MHQRCKFLGKDPIITLSPESGLFQNQSLLSSWNRGCCQRCITARMALNSPMCAIDVFLIEPLLNLNHPIQRPF
jgi:hypothetical protein